MNIKCADHHPQNLFQGCAGVVSFLSLVSLLLSLSLLCACVPCCVAGLNSRIVTPPMQWCTIAVRLCAFVFAFWLFLIPSLAPVAALLRLRADVQGQRELESSARELGVCQWGELATLCAELRVALSLCLMRPVAHQFGVLLADGQDGPFRFEIEHVTALRDFDEDAYVNAAPRLKQEARGTLGLPRVVPSGENADEGFAVAPAPAEAPADEPVAGPGRKAPSGPAEGATADKGAAVPSARESHLTDEEIEARRRAARA